MRDQGKQYFADLYLLKKGREKIMNSLSGAGRLAMEQPNPDRDMSYEERLRNSEQRFIEHKSNNVLIQYCRIGVLKRAK